MVLDRNEQGLKDENEAVHFSFMSHYIIQVAGCGLGIGLSSYRKEAANAFWNLGYCLLKEILE